MSGSLFQETITTLLVDDEAIAIHRLKKALQSYPQIKIVGEAMDGAAAVAMMNSLQPELVFLDIRMPAFDGFEVLDQLTYAPMIVFVTAYEEYAIRAFEKNSLDYLLKPVEEDRLDMTIRRVSQRTGNEVALLSKMKMMLREQQEEARISTIPVKKGDKIYLVQVNDIVYLEAREKYVVVHTEGEEQLIDISLTYLEERLPAVFVRVHRSFIVNKLKIREIQKYFKGTFILLMNDKQGARIKTSNTYNDTVKSKLLLP
ncbi:LytR/AlgR family response regulator transcription factor [Chitinophaga agri]|uniref:Response regulator transcription factor n=1 Tax=Chitinophaga agri TaxID=2703787 RepID=A0A6B9ZGL1_9BACT|nr:LytTR family DNA-binding domain-containing protein [Chitinophaga agri]QHS59723.1 response regulator transcription factor [Chitinophaga agri]